MILEAYNINLSHLGWKFAQDQLIGSTEFFNASLFNIGNVQGFCGEKNNILYICFQGTDGWNDIKDDLTFKKIDIGNGIKIHEGFYKQYKEIENFIMDKVKIYNSIIFSGHSLGSGIATICAYFIKQKFFNSKEVSCVLFSSPKVGNKKFVKSFVDLCITTKHYKYKNDPVPMLPFSILGYRYLLKPVIFGKYKWYDYLLLINPENHMPIHYMNEFKI